jgi:NAD(P)H-hydrate epimerase
MALLLSAGAARALDAEARRDWGLNEFALVEAAGRACARRLAGRFPRLFEAGGSNQTITVCAGGGNNGADALVLLRALILEGLVSPEAACVMAYNGTPPVAERGVRAEALRALCVMGVPCHAWNGTAPAALLEDVALIIDGIAGTGLRGPLTGPGAEMAAAINASSGARRAGPPLVVSIDVPSGIFDEWEAGMPAVQAGVTLAIEPVKAALYKPSARPCAGVILPVTGIFPQKLRSKYAGVNLVTWADVRERVGPVPGAAYKYTRGVVEIRAGSIGSVGAARIAARGAQAAGAGLTRLIVDEALYPLLAASAPSGVMVNSLSNEDRYLASGNRRFAPDAILLGPGWGRGESRLAMLRQAATGEAAGTALILDADAIALAKDLRFSGNTILTPHAGEMAAYAGVPKERLLDNPLPVLEAAAREKNVCILFKGHVLYAVSPDGRVGVVDGMAPVLANGGTGDLLAGICAAIAARMCKRADAGTSAPGFDAWNCALIAACLLIEAAQDPARAAVFSDPEEIAGAVARIAGAAWLQGGI